MTNLLHKIGAGIITIGLAVGGWFGVTPPEQQNPVLGGSTASADVVALFTTTLASRITSTATTMTLTSATDKDGNALASSTYGMIIDEGTASEELVLADCTSTACTNLTRGLSVRTGTTTVSALKFEHRRGAEVKITDAPALVFATNVFRGRQNIESRLSYDSALSFATSSNQIPSASWIQGMANVASSSVFNVFTTAANTFSGATSTWSQGILLTTAYKCGVGTNTLALCDKGYIDGVAVAGASNADLTTKGIVEQATAAELAAGTATGGTGAVLFADPATLAQSSYASSTQVKATITASATTTLSALPTRDTLDIWVYVASSTPTASNMQITFNGDSALNYSYYYASPGGLWSANNNVGWIPCALTGTVLGGGYVCHIQVLNNVSSIPKMGNLQGVGFSNLGIGSGRIDAGFRYNNTGARVTSVTVASDSATKTFDGYIIVYGK